MEYQERSDRMMELKTVSSRQCILTLGLRTMMIMLVRDVLSLADQQQTKELKRVKLVKDGPGWWINFFKDSSDLGLFNGSDPAHQDCI